MATLRVKYREREIELEVELAEIDTVSDGCVPAPCQRSRVLDLLGMLMTALISAIVFVVTYGFIALRWMLRELVCLILASLGLVGRALDAGGRAATRHSWLLTTVESVVSRPSLPSNTTIPVLARANEHQHASN